MLENTVGPIKNGQSRETGNKTNNFIRLLSIYRLGYPDIVSSFCQFIGGGILMSKSYLSIYCLGYSDIALSIICLFIVWGILT